MNSEKTEIVEYSVAYLALEIAILIVDMFIKMCKKFCSFQELLPTNVTNIQAQLVSLFHVSDNFFCLSFEFFFHRTEQTIVLISFTPNNLFTEKMSDKNLS